MHAGLKSQLFKPYIDNILWIIFGKNVTKEIQSQLLRVFREPGLKSVFVA